jgi:hypothetical protein
VPWAVFREQEDAQGYMEWLWAVSRRHGLPLALYVGRHGIFQRHRHEVWTLEEELAGGPLPTQFGRALQELDIQPFTRSVHRPMVASNAYGAPCRIP